MKINDLTGQFGSVTAGTLSEVQFNIWLLNMLKTHPENLFSVLAFKNVNEANIKYLWFDNATGYGHGIDEAYINGLTNVAGGWTGVSNIIPTTNYNTMFASGQQAFNYAYNNQHLFTVADLLAGRVAVITGPYYVNYLCVRSLIGLMDGVIAAGNSVLQAAGYTQAAFTIDNALTIRNPWFWSTNIPVIFALVDTSSYHPNSLTRDISILMMNGVKSTFRYNSIHRLMVSLILQ